MRRRIILDTGPLVALLNVRDNYPLDIAHQRVEFLTQRLPFAVDRHQFQKVINCLGESLLDLLSC